MIQPDEKILWQYLDGELDETASLQLEKQIEEDAATAILFANIAALHHLLGSQQLEQPSLRFEKNLMEKIHTQDSPSAYNQLIPRVNSMRISLVVVAMSFLSILFSGIVPTLYFQQNLFPETFSGYGFNVLTWVILAFWGVVGIDRWMSQKSGNRSGLLSK
ncbi:MAG: hypothetical protein R3C61_19400 [Bacteroidia bacterium]